MLCMGRQKSGDDAQFALAPRRHRTEAQLVVKAVELALARLAIGLGVARVALGLLGRLRAEEADADMPAEDVVPPHLHFRLRPGGEAAADFLQALDQRV